MCNAEEKKQDGRAQVAHRLARSNILELLPYRCARDDYSDGILLDANENPYGPTQAKGSDNHNTLERYPDPYQIPLKEAFCRYRNVKNLTPANVFVGVGSDEAIDLLMRIFCTPGRDKIVTMPPTYGMYKVCAKVNDVQVVTVPLTPTFDVRVSETLAAVTPETKLLFVCSPGNPTAKSIPLEDIEALASSYDEGLVVVDEAYVDFSSIDSALSLIDKYPNIVVLQTLSKAFGLAGIRCGFCIGSPDVIQLMNNVKAPYNINAITSEIATAAFSNTNVLKDNVGKILHQRTVVRQALEELDFVEKVYSSDSSFLLFRVANNKALELYKNMADTGGVVTRYRGSEIHCESCIRVTIGTEEENQEFLKTMVETWNKLASS